MLAQTIALARRIDPRPTIAYSPPDADPGDFPGCSLLPVAGDDGAICLENALREAFTGTPLVALGGDAPDLPPERLEEVVRKLEDYDAVFVPTFDGGFSCLGLRKRFARCLPWRTRPSHDPSRGVAGRRHTRGSSGLSRPHRSLNCLRYGGPRERSGRDRQYPRASPAGRRRSWWTVAAAK
ncbi:MAG: DUF2064 domain-containing protein [Planctomycetota bacterium]